MGAFWGRISENQKLCNIWADSFTKKMEKEVNMNFVGNEFVMDIHLVTDNSRPQVCDGVYVSKDDGSVILLCVGYIYSIEGETNAEKNSEIKPLGELMLDSYQRYGMRWLDRVNGQFAFIRKRQN